MRAYRPILLWDQTTADVVGGTLYAVLDQRETAIPECVQCTRLKRSGKVGRRMAESAGMGMAHLQQQESFSIVVEDSGFVAR